MSLSTIQSPPCVTWKYCDKIPIYLEISWMTCLRGRWGWSLTRGGGPSEAGEGEGGASGHRDHQGRRASSVCPDPGRGGWGAASGTGSPGRSGWTGRVGVRQNLAKKTLCWNSIDFQNVWKFISTPGRRYNIMVHEFQGHKIFLLPAFTKYTIQVTLLIAIKLEDPDPSELVRLHMLWIKELFLIVCAFLSHSHGNWQNTFFVWNLREKFNSPSPSLLAECLRWPGLANTLPTFPVSDSPLLRCQIWSVSSRIKSISFPRNKTHNILFFSINFLSGSFSLNYSKTRNPIPCGFGTFVARGLKLYCELFMLHIFALFLKRHHAFKYFQS